MTDTRSYTGVSYEDRLDIILSSDSDVVIDIESNHAEIRKNDWELWGVGFCVAGYPVYVTDFALARDILSYIMQAGRILIGHNIKFDLKGMKKGGILDEYPFKAYDTMAAMSLVNENLHKNQYGLKFLVKKFFDYQMGSYKETSKYGRDSEEFLLYNEDDTYWDERLWRDVILPQLQKRKVWKLFDKIYAPKTVYLADEEDYGVPWDIQWGKRSMFFFANVRDKAAGDVRSVVGDDISIDSHDQLRDRLFNDMGLSTEGLKLTKKTKKPSLDAEGVEVLAEKNPKLVSLVQYRNAEKMNNTYVVPWTNQAVEDPRHHIYPSFHQTSVTGRKRSDFQNLPVFTDKQAKEYSIRGCVRAEAEHSLIVPDLSQVELRLGAHVSGDETMTKAYCTWSCGTCGESGYQAWPILLYCPNCGAEADEKHKKNPAAPGFWHGLDIHQITADDCSIPRDPSVGVKGAAKNVNFLLLYSGSAYRAWQQFGTYELDKWEDILDMWFRKYPGIKKWHMWSEEKLKTDGWVRCLFGRIRTIPPEQIRRSWKHSFNQFVNSQIQTPGAHWLDLASANIRKDFVDVGVWMDGVYPSLEVHDELDFVIRNEYITDAIPIIEHRMRTVAPLNVPIDVETHVVERWHDAK